MAQIHADSIGVPLELTEAANAPALGCAILAGYGTGRFPAIEEGCKAMVRRRTIVEPDTKRTQLYEREVYPRYRALYGALKAVRDARVDGRWWRIDCELRRYRPLTLEASAPQGS